MGLTEEERLAALAAYGVLDTPPEVAFDELTKLAAALCDTPMALVSFVDRDRQWFKSSVGVDATETPRAISFCTHAIGGAGPFVVPDARSDERFAQNPLVTGPMALQFYAGVPLTDANDASLGTLCVLDTRPRVLSELQLNALRVLAKQLLAQLEVRKLLVREQALRAEVELAHRRAALLADAAALLAASLDTDRTLEAVARLPVPLVADVCTIVVCHDDGSLRRVGEAAIDTATADATRRLRERALPHATLPMRHALDARHPVLFPDYPAWISEKLGADDPYVHAVRDLGVRSVICAPMKVGARDLGVLSVGSTARTFTEDDVVTMGDLAQRAAVALENARLFADAQRERARAEQANHAKDAFLAAVSHELRTPLSAILGWAQMLRTDPDDVGLRARAMEVIERSARSQSRLIEDLLDSSRIAAGQLHVEVEAVNLLAVVGGALETLRPTAEAQGVTLTVDLDPEAMHGLGDFGRLQQVVWNLASNAIKFSRKGGHVDVRLQRDGDIARLTVRDDGRGIPPALLPDVFEQFRQDDHGVGRRMGGLGLGLAIAKHIVTMVGGTIAAHSDGEGKGATFTVTLPLSTTTPGPALALAVSSTIDASFDGAASLRGARVLVVDDDADTRSVLAELLAANGAEVTTAGSAEDAFDVFRRERPDVIVSDVMMGGASGYDLVRRVRDLPPQDGGRTPALALTGNTSSADRTRALAAGFERYVPKPIEPNELLTVVATLCACARDER